MLAVAPAASNDEIGISILDLYPCPCVADAEEKTHMD